MKTAILIFACAALACAQTISPVPGGAATTATTATNLAGGTANQVPYQTGAGTTGFHSPNVANGPVVLDGSGNASLPGTLLVGTMLPGPYALAALNALTPPVNSIAVVTDSSNCTSQTIGQVQLCRFVSAGVWASIGGSGGSSTSTEYNAGTCTTTASIDAANGAYQRILLGGNCTLSFVQPASGAVSYTHLTLPTN